MGPKDLGAHLGVMTYKCVILQKSIVQTLGTWNVERSFDTIRFCKNLLVMGT